MGYTHGKRWTDELIKQGILEVVKGLGLQRMPTRKECVEFTNSNSLAVKVSKREGGWYQLAKELGLPIKYSETTMGKFYENRVAEILIDKGYKVTPMSQNFPYDLLVDDYLKIDVKASHLYKGNAGNFYSFRIGKKYSTCDFYILVALNDKDEIVKIYVVPNLIVIKNKQISIGEFDSFYNKLIDKWELLDTYLNFYKEEILNGT